MVHRGHLNLGAFQRTKTAFDDHQPLITASGIFKADSVVIGFEHPFAIILDGLTYLAAVEQDARMLIIDDKRKRKTAKNLKLPRLGIGGVLIAAKSAEHLKEVTSVLNDLSRAGSHISPSFPKAIIHPF